MKRQIWRDVIARKRNEMCMRQQEYYERVLKPHGGLAATVPGGVEPSRTCQACLRQFSDWTELNEHECPKADVLKRIRARKTLQGGSMSGGS